MNRPERFWRWPVAVEVLAGEPGAASFKVIGIDRARSQPLAVMHPKALERPESEYEKTRQGGGKQA